MFFVLISSIVSLEDDQLWDWNSHWFKAAQNWTGHIQKQRASHRQGNTKCSFRLRLLPWLKQVITAFSLVKPSKWINFSDLRIHHKYPTERPRTVPLWSTRHFCWCLYLLSNLQWSAKTQWELSHFTMLNIQFHYYFIVVYSSVHSHTNIWIVLVKVSLEATCLSWVNKHLFASAKPLNPDQNTKK